MGVPAEKWMVWAALASCVSGGLCGARAAAPQGYALRFHGTGSGDEDRVKIALDAPHRPVDVGGSFTVEFWMRALPGENGGTVSAAPNGDGWITGNVLLDRDVYGDGDFGDWGIALGSDGRLAFGVSAATAGRTIKAGSGNVSTGAWFHVAATRDGASGVMRLFVGGNLVANDTGPAGNLSYRNGRATSYPLSDPFLVLGAEKHDAGAEYPSFSGWMDELRVSDTVRYTANFTVPAAPFVPDANTVALYHFDEGFGPDVRDTSDAAGGPSHGVRKVGSTPPGTPLWSDDTPFAAAADRDGDGMWDWYETAWFGGSGAGAAAADGDADGLSNLDEFRAGTNPTDPASRFYVIEAARSGGNFSVTFPTVEGKVYRVERSAALAPPWTQVGGNVAGTGAPATVTDGAAGGADAWFYRVVTGP